MTVSIALPVAGETVEGRGGNGRRPGGAGVVGPYHLGSSVVATVFCVLGMLHLRCLRNLSFQSQTDYRVGFYHHRKLGYGGRN